MSMNTVMTEAVKKHITAGSYADRPELVSVTMPERATHIDDDAFMNCANLREVFFPESLHIFGNRVFAGCVSLERIALPGQLKCIPMGTFDGCRSLESVTLPECAEKIESRAFAGYTALKFLRIPKKVYHLGNNVFDGTDVTVVLPDASPLFADLRKKGVNVLTEAGFAAAHPELRLDAATPEYKLTASLPVAPANQAPEQTDVDALLEKQRETLLSSAEKVLSRYVTGSLLDMIMRDLRAGTTVHAAEQ